MAARQSSKLEAGVRLSLPVLDETTLLHDVAAAWQTLNLLALVRIQVKHLADRVVCGQFELNPVTRARGRRPGS